MFIALLTTIDFLSFAIDETVGLVVKFVPNTSLPTAILLFIAVSKVTVVLLDTAFATSPNAGS